MGKSCPVLRGQNLGVIIGGDKGIIIDRVASFYHSFPKGIFLYKPQNNLVPKERMTCAEYLSCVPPGTEQVLIPFEDVRNVFVNGEFSKWFNYYHFKTSSTCYTDQSYFGRGEVIIELASGPGIERLIESLLARDLALRRGEPLPNF